MAWQAVKARQDLRLMGGWRYIGVTRIRLTNEGIDQVVNHKLYQVESRLVTHYPEFDRWPADAQLGLLSMAWAMGPDFHFPRFRDAARSQDWDTCALECHINDDHNPGLRPRNEANKELFENAEWYCQTEPEVVHYSWFSPA